MEEGGLRKNIYLYFLCVNVNKQKDGEGMECLNADGYLCFCWMRRQHPPPPPPPISNSNDDDNNEKVVFPTAQMGGRSFLLHFVHLRKKVVPRGEL
jgi:hypothetical protein